MVLVQLADAEVAADRLAPPPLPTPARPSLPRSQAASDAANLADTVEDPTVYGAAAGSAGEGTMPPPPEEPAFGFTDASPIEGPAAALPSREDEASVWAFRWQTWLLLGGAGVLGAGLAVGLFGWISGPRPVARPAATPPEAVAKRGSEKPRSSPRKAALAAPARTETGTASAEKPAPVPAGKAAEPLSVPQPEKPKGAPGEPPPGSKESLAPDAPPGLAPAAADSKADDLTPGGSLRATLKAFGALLEDPGPPPPEPSAPVGAEPAVAPEKVPAADAPPARPAPREVDVASRLQDQFEHIEFQQTPLADFLQFLSDFSTIPITLDPDILPWLGISPASPVTLREDNATVESVLDKALQPFGLGYVVDGDQILVTRVAAADAAVRELSLDVADLAGNDPRQLTALGGLIAEVIAPASWEAGGGPGSWRIGEREIVIRHEERILFQVLELCEKLRVARGLPPRSKLDASLFQLRTRAERARPRLQQPVSPYFLRPVPLVSVLKRMAQDAGVQLLVDWRAAALAGWNPDAEVTFTASQQPLETALRALLEPMDLACRIAGENVLQVTTREELETRIELEVHPLGDLYPPEPQVAALLGQMRAHLGEERFRENGGACVLRVDPKSRCLLAALPQPQQVALAEFLQAKRSAKAP